MLFNPRSLLSFYSLFLIYGLHPICVHAMEDDSGFKRPLPPQKRKLQSSADLKKLATRETKRQNALPRPRIALRRTYSRINLAESWRSPPRQPLLTIPGALTFDSEIAVYRDRLSHPDLTETERVSLYVQLADALSRKEAGEDALHWYLRAINIIYSQGHHLHPREDWKTILSKFARLNKTVALAKAKRTTQNKGQQK